MTKRNKKVIYSEKCFECKSPLKGRQRRWCSHICDVNYWQKRNKDKVNKYKAIYLLRNPEKRKEAVKRYDTSERGKEKRKIWVEKNWERLKEQARINSKRYRDRLTTQRHKRRAIIKELKEHFTREEWQEMKEKYGFKCLICKKQEPEILLTPDHVIPLLRGGNNTINNIQPLCEKCNRKKYIKILDYRN